MNETWEKGQPETGYLAPVLRGRCKEQSQPNWESSQEVHTKKPRKAQNSCSKISERKRHQIVVLYYEWITRCLKSSTHKVTNSEGANSVKCSNGHFINLKGNALSDKGSTENWREPRSPTSHTMKAFNTQSFFLVRGSYWYLWLRWYSVSIDLLWSLANNDSLHPCSFALDYSTHASSVFFSS